MHGQLSPGKESGLLVDLVQGSRSAHPLPGAISTHRYSSKIGDAEATGITGRAHEVHHGSTVVALGSTPLLGWVLVPMASKQTFQADIIWKSGPRR